jgi:hypothetical protein
MGSGKVVFDRHLGRLAVLELEQRSVLCRPRIVDEFAKRFAEGFRAPASTFCCPNFDDICWMSSVQRLRYNRLEIVTVWKGLPAPALVLELEGVDQG